MQVTGIKTRPLIPPQDSLRDALKEAIRFSPKEGDIVCISSKVVSIDEGRTLPIEAVPDKEKLIEQESDFYLKAPKTSRYRRRFTFAKGGMAGSAGIDESNGSEHYILYPKDPFASAKKLRTWLMKEYGVQELAVIITDSTSLPLRRGAIGFALSWDGIDPLRDYRGTPDIFGRLIQVETANLIDAFAAAAVLEMGEGSECMPVAIIRDAKNTVRKNRSPRNKTQLIVDPQDDVFAPFFFHKSFKWKRGGKRKN
ncbi:MAG TPA: coenzyme F420-0:L-glutamate ligase [Candidatus Paceibacterota bacterium]|jgi:F420-0:gamma-glutamyl ligase|nr:coenzyme F420-0:L-glutamate ligase [Candidatus Paceibacterota bacterium]